MSEFFSVQMNMTDIPNVQVEQSANTSVEIPAKSADNSFDSVFQQVLPKDTNENISEAAAPSQGTVSDLANPNDTTEKTATSIDQSLLFASDNALKANVLQLFAYLTGNTILKTNETTVPEEPVNLENNQIIDPKLQTNLETKQTIDPTLQASLETTQIIDPKLQASPETSQIIDPKQASLETTQIIDPKLQASLEADETATTISNPLSTDFDEDVFIEYLSTYFTSDSSKDIQETLKDIRTTLAQVNSSLIAPGKQDDLTFGASTKNIGELQNLLARQSGTELPITPNSSINLSSQQQALLERIQSFIANGQEAGTVSIKNIQLPDQGSSLRNRLAHFSSPIQAINIDNNPAETSPIIKGDGFTALEEGVFAPTLRSRQQQLIGVRHDSNQQYYDAKTQAQNVINESTNLADNQKGDGAHQSGSGFNQMSSTGASPETSSTFSMTNNTSLNPLTGQVTDPTKTTTLPTGTVVQDQEVIQQLVQRFQVNKRQLDTKIQLKLHPVELGKMEIDLTVKEGSIRANVVAQSQHVQEIIERNIAKLRSVLEQQGFNVEEITVTSGSETVGDFDSFEQQLPHRDTSSFRTQNDRNESHAQFNLDISEDSDNDAKSGVNVKA